MSALGNILRKEIKELLTPATILPIVLITVIFGAIGSTMGGIDDEVHKKPIIGLINEDNSSYSSIVTNVFYTHADVVYNGTSSSEKQEGIKTVKDHKGTALLSIPSNFSSNLLEQQKAYINIYWIIEGTGIFDSFPSASVETLLQYAEYNISTYMIKVANATSNATLILSPVRETQTTEIKGHEYVGISPGEITALLATQSTTTPIVMMMIIIISGGMVISSMALEKENKTLETLLTLPVSRGSIVTGKIAASAIVGLLLALIYMVGIGYYMASFTFEDPSGASSFSLSLTPLDLTLVGISLFITLVAGLSLCMLLGTMAKNYKSAQTLTAPITMLAIFPMLLTMFTDFNTLPTALQVIVFAIPFSHPMMAPKALIFGEYWLVIAGIIYVSVFAIVVILLIIWVFKTDRLITGSNISHKFFKHRLRK